MKQAASVRLERACPDPPAGVVELIDELAGGENGFGGTPVYSGAMTLGEYLEQCCAMSQAENVPPELVPQTVFWVVDRNNMAVGMVRMRHYLNDRLRDHGGHIGYFIRRGQRGKGYGSAALRLALAELGKLGETRALLTVDRDNHASIGVIEANGGRLASTGIDESGRAFGRYWIELSPG